MQHGWTTSWGTSTRMMGGLIMCHGDDKGLRVPPRLAATQVVVVLVRDEGGAGDVAEKLLAELRAHGVRAELDARTDIGFGRRAVDWELKGVPLRIDVGPREVADGDVTVSRRDTGAKVTGPFEGLAASVPAQLEEIQAGMLAAATARARRPDRHRHHHRRGSRSVRRRAGRPSTGRPS